jgi:hypothetical protein
VTASLSPPIGENFASAINSDLFFGKTGREDVLVESEKREQPLIGKPSESCNTNLFFGFFFDGTKNNYIKAETGKNHSNVARLYDCYPGLSVPGVLPISTDWPKEQQKKYPHFFKVYIPGVASPFKQVNDTGEGRDEDLGAAAGALGEYRIIWALVQAINNVHRYFLRMPLVSQSEMDGLLRDVYLNKAARALMLGTLWQDPRANHTKDRAARIAFEGLLRKLHKAVAQHWPDAKTGKPAKIDPGIVKTIYITVFGFSRGATQARAFVNWLQSLCKLDAQIRGKSGMSLGGFQVEFDFLGLFDTVASVGLANTIGGFNGHGAWADAEDSLRIPEGVKCLHLVAAHELRRSFPVDSISVNGILPEECREIVVPGVHSDVGCGYCPREQGRGTDPNGDDMLARIPLLLMYKEARLNGAPLKLELAPSIAKARFAIKPETIAAYNAYIAACRVKQGPIHLIMREQARMQIEWRLARRVNGNRPLQKSASFLRASTFDQNDLYSAGLEFEKEIEQFEAWLKEQGARFKPAIQSAGFGNRHSAEWEEIATWWTTRAQPSAAVMNFFDNYIHDSRAWFKVVPNNPDHEKDMHVLLSKWVQRRRAAKAHNEMRSKMHGRGNSRYSMVATDGLDEDERRAADEYAKTGRIPRMITKGREPHEWGIAGYLRFRKIYGGLDDVLLSSIPSHVSDGAMLAAATAYDQSGSATG